MYCIVLKEINEKKEEMGNGIDLKFWFQNKVWLTMSDSGKNLYLSISTALYLGSVTELNQFINFFVVLATSSLGLKADMYIKP